MQLKKQTPDGRRRQQRQGKQHPTYHPSPKPLPRDHPDHSLHHRPPDVNKRNITLHIKVDLHRNHHPHGEQLPPQSIPHITLTTSHHQTGLLQNPTFPETIYQNSKKRANQAYWSSPHNRRKETGFHRGKISVKEKNSPPKRY